MDRILSSDGFSTSARMARFLRFTVESALRGDTERLKEYAIGLEVFDKPPAFDPRIDSIVRVEARRLRRKLREYYESAGKRDPVAIEFPEGSYAPCFRSRPTAPAKDAADAAGSAAAQTLAVLPFTDIGGDERERAFCEGLGEDVVAALTKLPGLRIASRRAIEQLRNEALAIPEIGKRLNVEMILDGTVRSVGERVRVAVQLIDVADGFNLWSETYERRLRDVLTVQAELADAIARDLAAGPLK